MRRQNLILGLVFCAPLLLASCGDGGQANANGASTSGASNNGAAASNIAPTTATTNSAAAPTSRGQEVTARAEEVRLRAGGAGEASVRLDMAKGFHVQANPASDKYYVATELRAEPQAGVEPGKPVYPPGVKLKLAFSDEPLLVYESGVVIKLPLRAGAGATSGRQTFRAKVRVQPCDDQACLPPREIDATIPVTID
jgi:hypothetical protein